MGVVYLHPWKDTEQRVKVMPKRLSCTVGYKLKAVELAEATNNRSAGKTLGINEKLIRDWR